MFESKIYAKVFDSLGYTYENVSSASDLENAIKNNSYKLVIYDKELHRVSPKLVRDDIKISNEITNLETKIILVSDPSMLDTDEDRDFVDEIIKNVVNKDQLKSTFEKFI